MGPAAGTNPITIACLLAAAQASGNPDPAPFGERVREALDNDLDAPAALEALDDLASAILSDPSVAGDSSAVKALHGLSALIGVDLTMPFSIGAEPL